MDTKSQTLHIMRLIYAEKTTHDLQVLVLGRNRVISDFKVWHIHRAMGWNNMTPPNVWLARLFLNHAALCMGTGVRRRTCQNILYCCRRATKLSCWNISKFIIRPKIVSTEINANSVFALNYLCFCIVSTKWFINGRVCSCRWVTSVKALKSSKLSFYSYTKLKISCLLFLDIAHNRACWKAYCVILSGNGRGLTGITGVKILHRGEVSSKSVANGPVK